MSETLVLSQYRTADDKHKLAWSSLKLPSSAPHPHSKNSGLHIYIGESLSGARLEESLSEARLTMAALALTRTDEGQLTKKKDGTPGMKLSCP